MKVENLSVGQIVKNYKELCSLLGEPIKTSNSKKAQLKEWERYFKCDRSGHSFTIREIYEKPLDKRGQERQGIYNEIVQVLIMDLLSRNEGNLIITKESLTRKIGLTNANYSLGFRHQNRMSEYLEVDNTILGDFYKVNTSSISTILNNALASLERKFIIDKQEVMMIQYNNETSPRVATPFDREMIQAINREALLFLGLNESDIKTRNANYYKFKEFRDQLINQRTQIKYHYKAIDIVFSHKFLEHEINELSNTILSKINKDEKMKELNSLYANKSIEKAENRHNQAIESVENKEELTALLLARFSDVYVSTFQKVTNNLIRLDAPIINKSTFFNKHNEQLSDAEIETINESLPF